MSMDIDLELYRRDVLVSASPRVQLSVIDAGPGDATETFVFLHGFGGRALQWGAQVAHFATDKRCIAIDLRGHGLSDAPLAPYTLDQMLSDIERTLSALRVRPPFVLFGHSFGGALATSYTLAHPDHVAKLVLACMPDHYRLPAALRLPFYLPAGLLDPVRERVRIYAPAHVLKPLYWQALDHWNGAELLPRLTVPTLVLIGQRDFTYPPSRYWAVSRLVPGAHTVELPSSAHLAPLERPDAVNRAVQRFVGERRVSWRDFARASAGPGRPWTRFYDQGVPADIRVPPQPLHRFLSSAARRRPGRPATVFYGATLTYHELDRRANRLAHALAAQGVQPGDRVLILLPNCPQAVLAFYAVLKAGAAVVMASPLATVDELAYLLRDSGAVHAVTLTEWAARLFEAAGGAALRRLTVTDIEDYLPPHVRAARRGRKPALARDDNELPVDRLTDLLASGSDLAPDVSVAPSDLACLQYTSGTTGDPKGVMLTHANLVANTVQTRAWLPDVRFGREVYLSVLPLWHSYGLLSAMNVAVSLAAAMVLLPQFEAGETLRAIKRYRPTIFPGVPPMFMAIKDYPDVRKYGVASIRACISGAAPLPVEVQETFEKLTRGRLVEGYGLTEAGPATHINPLGGRRRVGSIGVPLPGTDAKIVDLVSGADLPPGEIGELCVRGPQVMRGYWNRPAETAAALRDGWLHTGDVSRMDEDGFFQIVERKADVWAPQVGGQAGGLVFPRDVEEVLYEHPKIRDAAVVPVGAGDESGLKAFVVLKPNQTLTPAEVIDYARGRLVEEAIPRWVELVSDLPRSPIGKVIRRLLVQRERAG